jgi:hypothetical protein
MHLLIYPATVGSGQRLFGEDAIELSLVNSNILSLKVNCSATSRELGVCVVDGVHHVALIWR